MATATLSNTQLKRLRRQAKEKLERQSTTPVTAFRAEEHYWKDRARGPDWNNAFSIDSTGVEWDAENTSDEIHGIWEDRNGVRWAFRRLRLIENGKFAVAFTDLPGLVLLPGYLSRREQRDLVTACLQETTTPHSRSNLDTHYLVPAAGWWKTFVDAPDSIVEPRYSKYDSQAPSSQAGSTSRNAQRVRVDLPEMDEQKFLLDKRGGLSKKKEPLPSETVRPVAIKDLIRKLRWTIVGLEYHWGTKSYKWDRPPMPMPALITETASRIVQDVPWSRILPSLHGTNWASDYKAEAGVVNFYQVRDALTAHVDQSEVDAVRPLVSISLGESAIFLIGGKTREERPIALMLRSGDAVVMSGESRRVFHGIPRIVEGESRGQAMEFSGDVEDSERIRNFLCGTRINVNVRQVFADG